MFKEKYSFGLESADRVPTEEEIEELKKGFRQRLHYYRDQEPWQIWTRDRCYKHVRKYIDAGEKLDMEDLRVYMEQYLTEKEYTKQGFNVNKNMILKEYNKFEHYLPVIREHVDKTYSRLSVPVYDPDWSKRYTLNKINEIIQIQQH